jgi:hypothetical protein
MPRKSIALAATVWRIGELHVLGVEVGLLLRDGLGLVGEEADLDVSICPSR